MTFPFIGLIDFGIIYTVILLPLGIAVASNLTNMLAGFNGNESGMGIIMFIVILIVSFYSDPPTADKSVFAGNQIYFAINHNNC